MPCYRLLLKIAGASSHFVLVSRGFSIWFVVANVVAETRNEIIHKAVVKY